MNTRFRYIISAFAVAAGILCSCEKEAETKDITFPELQEKTCAANETVELSFNAQVGWQLVSDKGWCKFIDGEFRVSSMSGKAGEQVITAAVNEDGQNFDTDDVAKISLTMDGKSQVIYEIKRPRRVAVDYEIKDEEGNLYNQENPIRILGSKLDGSEVLTTVTVVTDFEVGVLPEDAPEWLEIRADGAGKFSLSFRMPTEEVAGYPDPAIPFGTEKNYSLTFTINRNGGVSDKMTVPLTYAGLDPAAVGISPAYMDLTVSSNGRRFVGDNNEVMNEYISSTVMALNNDFHIVEFGITRGGSGQSALYDFSANGDLTWVKTTRKGRNLTIGVTENPNENAREAIVMAFPAAVYNEFGSNLKANIIDPDTESIIHSQYILAVIKQSEKKVQAEWVSFSATYRYTPEDDVVAGVPYMPISDPKLNLDPVEVINWRLENPDDAATYGVAKDNVWKMIIPKSIAMDNGSKLVVEGVGMGEGQKVTELAPHAGVSGQELSGQAYSQEAGIFRAIEGWGISFNNPETYDNSYKLTIKNEAGETIALCLIEIEKNN